MMSPEANHPAVSPADGAAPPKAVQWSDLPENLRLGLSSIPVDRWSDVIVTICQSDLMKDATSLVAAFVRVWEKSRRAEDFIVDRVTGPEREQFRDSFCNALRQIAEVTVTLGGRARLVEELQKDRKLFARHAQAAWQKVWTKAMARQVTSSGQAPVQSRGVQRGPKSGSPGLRPEPAKRALPSPSPEKQAV